ncbi:uncharacterized protein LOC109837663 [Asparagus officinalis]|uniref:uncharacterized protein LOC109837663 n=1 Tax=Asparagus officinalis TaxID=4686 RepID=UPI00098E8475|nr:uncharacterized protein LOC109837663 [Asparagus officinalis]
MTKTKELASSSSAMRGTFTRSRSEIFLHRTRSGRIRSDPKRRHQAPTPHVEVKTHNSVKDLRSKRIFSVQKPKIEISIDEKSGSDDLEISKGSMQVTVPHLDTNSDFDGGKRVRVSEKTNSGNSPENIMGFSSCSKLKLIENPTSINYRRLLPFLKDITKDGSSGIEVIRSHKFSVKVENPMKEMPPLLTPSSEKQNHAAPLADSPMINSHGNVDRDKNQVLQDRNLDAHVEIVKKPMKVESPTSCGGSKMLSEVTTKEEVNENNMDELKRRDHEIANKEKDGSDAEKLKVSENCREDIVQSTPPDAELTRKLDGTEFGSGRTISPLKSALKNTSRNYTGLVSCSRSKLYRNPSSFNYRRLLPYLSDLAKHESSGLEIIDSKNIKVENSIEERSPMSNDTPLPRKHNSPVLLVDSPPSHLQQNENLEMNHVPENPGLDSEGDTQNPVTKESNSCSKSKLQIFGDTSGTPPERSDFEFEMLWKSSSTPTIPEGLSFRELSGSMLEFSHSPMETVDRPYKNVSQFEVPSSAMNRALAPKKGILKKQPRGCKGICMCLDCSSFRVHAERAYEFSRKQMSDADEVVEQLIKELSCLRNIVERSVVPVVDGPGSYTVLPISQEQVKGLSQRTFRVEEQARNRMRQMFCNLNAHCRIPGPKVTFSDSVNKRNIP